jgi:DtxR family transcriptional regulator, Mn-dependent transcriptional regulator
METLERLTRRQVDALQAVRAGESPDRGASLNGIAGRLRLRPPTALGHLTQLEELDLIARHRGKSRLTDRGRRTLLEYDRHHRIAEGLFDQLGLSAEDTCKAAREVDLALSHRTVERLCEAEGHPARCPHGESIPPCRDDAEAS